MLPESGWSVPEKPFDVFLSFNFLEHQPRPDIMLKAIWNNLAEDGMGLVTVPSLEYILEKGSYYELIRDHIAYYTFDTLRALLNHCGFAVLEEEMINRDTLSMIVRKTAMPEASAESADDRKVVADCARADAGIIAPLIASVVPWSEIARFTCGKSSAKRSITGTSPQVETVMFRMPICKPSL